MNVVIPREDHTLKVTPTSCVHTDRYVGCFSLQHDEHEGSTKKIKSRDGITKKVHIIVVPWLARVPSEYN